MLIERITAWAEEQASKRSGPARIGAHNCGKCVRMLWYAHHGATGEPVGPRAILTFDLGDRVEDAVLDFLTNAGLPLIRTNEKRDTAEIRLPDVAFSIRCRPDAYAEIGGERIIVEVKSVSDFAFARIERGELNEEHLAQVEVYMRTFGTMRAVLIYYRKETSHLHEVIVERDEARWKRIRLAIADAIADECPPRPYAVTDACDGIREGKCISGRTPAKNQPHKACGGSGKHPDGTLLPTYPCGYCPYKVECFGPLELVSREGQSPKWRIKP